jgi:hypothetical protein
MYVVRGMCWYWYEGRGYVGRGVAVHPYYITVHPYLFCGIKVKK